MYLCFMSMGRKRPKRKIKTYTVTTVTKTNFCDDTQSSESASSPLTTRHYKLADTTAAATTTDTVNKANKRSLRSSSFTSVDMKTDIRCKFDDEWLSEKDTEILASIPNTSESHHRWTTRQKEETLARQESNKMRMLEGLRVQNTTRLFIEERITDALNREQLFANINAFIIASDDGSMEVYDTSSPRALSCGVKHYELVRNKHKHTLIDQRNLFIDMIHHTESIKQLRHIFQYIENLPPSSSLYNKEWGTSLPYIIYKRFIEIVDGVPIDALDFWDRVEFIFKPKKTGFYYAIIVCFGVTPCISLPLTKSPRTQQENDDDTDRNECNTPKHVDVQPLSPQNTDLSKWV